MTPVLIQFAVVLISVVVIVEAIGLRNAPKARYFIYVSIAIGLFNLGYLLEVNAHSAQTAYAGSQVQMFALPLVAPLYYLFVRDYTNHALRDKRKIGLLFVIPLLNTLTACTYPHCTLFYRKLDFSPDPTPHLVNEPGPLYFLDTFYGVILILVAGRYVYQYLDNNTHSARVQRLLFLAVSILPVSCILMSRLHIYIGFLDLAPASFCLSAAALGNFIKKHRQQEWMPFARELVLENLQDGFVLLDNQERFLDANAAAKKLFPQMNTIAAGTPVSEIEDFPLALTVTGQPMREFTLKRAGRQMYLRISASPIAVHNNLICTVVMFYDATELHHLMEELHELATRDTLTGLYNRGHFFRQAGRDFQLATRAKQKAVLLMLDIDYFKNINDRYGHQCGDEVLVAVAQLLLNSLRATDIPARYGGEEFCIYLPGASRSNGRVVAEMLRRAIEGMQFHCRGEHFSITVSIGLAAMNRSRDKELDDLIARADRALYSAKAAGRNRLVSYREVEQASTARR